MFYLCQTDVPSHLCKCATVRPFICLSVKKKKRKKTVVRDFIVGMCYFCVSEDKMTLLTFSFVTQ